MQEISVKELNLNPITMISGKWLLITVGSLGNGYNTMIVCQGHIGGYMGA